MVADKVLATQTDYQAPLLRLLSELPDGQGGAAEVCRLFEDKYGHLISDEHRQLRSDGSPEWEKKVHWARYQLKEYDLVDAPGRGIWRITEAGRRWVEENPHVMRIKGVPKLSPQKSRRKSSPRKAASVPGITLEMLEQTRKAMPTDQFRQLWGALYDQLLTEERAKAITAITQTELGRRAHQRLDEIHVFLCGKAASLPPAEVLCDWIHFCYALELYREAAALLPYIRGDEVDQATYKRAKRVASLCRNKLTG